jgi:hypothetical protein
MKEISERAGIKKASREKEVKNPRGNLNMRRMKSKVVRLKTVRLGTELM